MLDLLKKMTNLLNLIQIQFKLVSKKNFPKFWNSVQKFHYVKITVGKTTFHLEIQTSPQVKFSCGQNGNILQAIR